MDKPAIPLSSSSSLSTVSSVHSQQCNAAISQNEAAAAVAWGAPGGLRKWGSTVAVHGAHQMWQMKHLKKAFVGNKSTKISLEAILTVHIHLKNRRHDCNRCVGILSTVPMSDPKRRCTSSRDPNSMGAEGPGTEMTQLQWSLRRALA